MLFTSSTFHSVYISTAPLIPRTTANPTSTFHSVYISTKAPVPASANITHSTFHSVYISTAIEDMADNANKTLHSTLFILVRAGTGDVRR